MTKTCTNGNSLSDGSHKTHVRISAFYNKLQSLKQKERGAKEKQRRKRPFSLFILPVTHTERAHAQSPLILHHNKL